MSVGRMSGLLALRSLLPEDLRERLLSYSSDGGIRTGLLRSQAAPAFAGRRNVIAHIQRPSREAHNATQEPCGSTLAFWALSVTVTTLRLVNGHDSGFFRMYTLAGRLNFRTRAAGHEQGQRRETENH